MVKILIQKFLSIRRKQSNISGFTLIELLVSILISSIIVGTLFGFLINILERDRSEQAKAETQEEIQSALNFIADDMSDAVYIYDADGLYRPGADGQTVADQLPHNRPNSGRCEPTGTGLLISRCTPVLVFWKRFRYDKDEEINHDNDSLTPEILVSCLERTTSNCIGGGIGGDKYVFSLVVYYLIKGNSISDPTWSDSSRIIRWEARSGLPYGCSTPPNCPDRLKVVLTDPVDYAILPDPGFDRFTLNPQQSIEMSFNNWRKSNVVNASYDFNVTSYDELIDFVDDTPYASTQDDGSIGNSPTGARVDINIIGNTTFVVGNPGDPAALPPVPPTLAVPSRNASCDDPNIGVGTGLTAAQLADPNRTVFAQRIPPNFGVVGQNRSQLSSFYACVNSSRVSARVYIRGNALARLRDTIGFRPVSDDVFESFVPTANLRVFGRGLLNNNI